MSIKLSIEKGGTRIQAVLKNEAWDTLIKLLSEHEEQQEPPKAADIIDQFSGGGRNDQPPADTTQPVKAWLSKHTASEVLNLIGWSKNPEKILLLGAFHEAKGGKEGWKSGDLQTRYSEAREPEPGNLSRDITSAVKDDLIGGVTARSYRVSRSGWNKIADAIAKLTTQ